MDTKKLEFVKMVGAYVDRYLPSIDTDVALWINAQFCLESDFGRSKISVSRFNICGMKQPSKRLTCSLPDSPVFACFSNYDVCFVDYLLCIAHHGCSQEHLSSVVRYRTFIGRFYCPERDYLNRVDKIFRELSYEFCLPL